MCTAATYCTKDFYFGRNLDLEYSYRESVTVTPRNFPFRFRYAGECRTHFALIGMAYVAENYPLYYDATNEKGLSMAGLAFWDSAYYAPEQDNGAKQVASYEFIPWVLGQCENLMQARELLAQMGLSERADHYPHQLSGGQQQRVAIARALVNNPSTIVADEPTGNLDPARSLEIMTLLERINALGTTVVVVTHEKGLVNHFDKRVITINDGMVAGDGMGRYEVVK